MKRILIALLLLMALTLTACSESRPYTWAIIVLNGEIIAEGHVDDWHSYKNGAVFIEIDGKRYLTSIENVVLMEKPPSEDAKLMPARC